MVKSKTKSKTKSKSKSRTVKEVQIVLEESPKRKPKTKSKTKTKSRTKSGAGNISPIAPLSPEDIEKALFAALASPDKSPKRKGEKKAKAEVKEIICGGYEKVKFLGQGAYGAVWKARKGKVEVAAKMVAIKEAPLNNKENSPMIRLISHDIIKEVDLMTRLRHPNVMTAASNVYLAPATGEGCLFTPLMGTNFKKILKMPLAGEAPYNDLSWSMGAFKKMLCGLAYLHSNFVLHCDLKPENVLYDPATDSVRLADYGLSVIFGSTGVIKYDSSVVTESWRPPEFFAREAYKYIDAPRPYYFGPEIDVYSMGWIGMELIFGIKTPNSATEGPERPLSYYEYHKAIGGTMGPGFSEKSLGYFVPNLNALAQGVSQNLGPPLDVNKPQKQYFREVALGRGITNPDLLDYVDVLSRTILAPPRERPSSRDLVNQFPDFLTGKYKPACQEITISYPPFEQIEYHQYYSLEDRQASIDLIEMTISDFADEAGEKNIDSVKLETIDLLDRISMVMPAKNDIHKEMNVASSIYIATALTTSWGVHPRQITKAWKDLEWATEFARRLVDIIAKLKSRLYRPTIDQLGVMTASEALEIFQLNLSPSRVQEVSSSELVEHRLVVPSAPQTLAPEKPKIGWFPTLFGFGEQSESSTT